MTSQLEFETLKKNVIQLTRECDDFNKIYQKIQRFKEREDLDSEILLNAVLLQALTLIRNGEYEEAEKCSEEVISKSVSLNLPKQYLEANILKISILEQKGEQEEGLKMISNMENYLEEHKEIISSDRLKILADLKYHKGSIYWTSGKTDLSFSILYECLKIREEIGAEEDIGYVFNRIGSNYYFKGEMEKALHYYQKNLDIQTNLENTLALGTCYNNIADIYYVRGDYELALESYQNALVFQKKTKNEYFISIYNANIGYIHTLLGEYEKALPPLKKAMKYCLTSKNDYVSSFTFFFMINLLLDYKDADEDINNYMKIFGDINKESNNEYVKDYYQLSKALVLKSSNKIRDKIKAQALLELLTEGEVAVYDITFKALLNLAELLLIELKDTSDEEILDKLDNLSRKMLDLAEKHNSAPYRIKTFLLQSKLALVNLEVDKAGHLLDTAEKIAEEKELRNLSRKIIEEKQLLVQQSESWEEMEKEGAPVSERVELSHVENTVSQMVTQRLEVFQEIELKKFKNELKDIADMIAERLELSSISVRGFNNFAVLEWQNQISLTIAETEAKFTSPEERIKMFKEVMQIFSQRIEQLLRRKDKLHLLPSTIEAAIELYRERYF